MSRTGTDSVDDWIAAQEAEHQSVLREVRMLVLGVDPGIAESISYGMPAYKLRGKPVAYFSAFAGHLGFYAVPAAHAEFTAELTGHKQGKGSVQFPWTQPIPFDLIRRMVAYNVERHS